MFYSSYMYTMFLDHTHPWVNRLISLGQSSTCSLPYSWFLLLLNFSFFISFCKPPDPISVARMFNDLVTWSCPHNHSCSEFVVNPVAMTCPEDSSSWNSSLPFGSQSFCTPSSVSFAEPGEESPDKDIPFRAEHSTSYPQHFEELGVCVGANCRKSLPATIGSNTNLRININI